MRRRCLQIFVTYLEEEESELNRHPLQTQLQNGYTVRLYPLSHGLQFDRQKHTRKVPKWRASIPSNSDGDCEIPKLWHRRFALSSGASGGGLQPISVILN